MSRSGKQQRSADREADDADDKEVDDDAIGGWQPVGEAVFWGAVFVGLTLAAFNLSDRSDKTSLTSKDADQNEVLKPDDGSDPQEPDDEHFKKLIERPTDEKESDRKRVDLTQTAAPKRVQDATLTPQKIEPPPVAFQAEPPARRLPVDAMMKKVAVDVKPVTAQPPPTQPAVPMERLEPSRFLKVVELVPAPTRLNVAAMMKTPRWAPPSQRMDVNQLQKRARLEPLGSRLNISEVQKRVVLSPVHTRLPVERLLRSAVLTPPTQRLPWETLLRTARANLNTRRTDLATLYKPASLALSDDRLAWREMTKAATLDPATHRLGYETLVKSPRFEPAYRDTDMDELSRMAKLISLPDIRREPPMLAATVQKSATPMKSAVPLATPPPATKPSPIALELRTLPSMRRVGDALVVVARVVGAGKEAIPEQMVEWNIDRLGAGRLLALPSDSKLGPIGEKPLPTFARSYTATAPHRVNEAWGGVEIQRGETWCVVESPTSGAMHLSARAPGVASVSAGYAAVVVQWDHARAEFPEPLIAQAGGESLIAAKVVSAEDGSAVPLPEYHVRYTLTEPGGAVLASGRKSIEVESLADGSAPIVLKQPTPTASLTKGKVEVLGRRPLAGHQATVLCEGVFQVTWTPPDAALVVNGPTVASAEEWTTLAVAVNSKRPGLSEGLRLFALPPSDVEVRSSERTGSAVDLGAWPAADGRPLEIAVRHDRPASRTIRFELRQGRHVWSVAEHSIRFSSPDIVVTQKLPAVWKVASPSTATVTVQNRGLAAAKSIRVRCEPPIGFRIVDPKRAKLDGNVLEWIVERLDGGAKENLEYTAAATSTATGSFRATATGKQWTDPAVSTVDASVAGRPSLSISVSDAADPIEVGEEVEYQLTIENQGDAAAKDVAVEIISSTGVELLTAVGTLGGESKGGYYKPPVVKDLPAHGKLTQKIRAKAIEKGDARFIVRLSHGSLPGGSVDQHESTVVFQP